MNESNLISKVWNFAHVLRDDGVGFFSPSPTTARHASPHRAFHLNYRTVVGK